MKLDRNLVNEREPEQTLTDEEWQSAFEYLKSITSDCGDKYMKPELPVDIYALYINLMLLAMRQGELDYCFYIYQVADLLTLEHDKLRSKFNEKKRCFEV